MKMTMGNNKFAIPFVPVTQVITSGVGSYQNIAVPVGATTVRIRVIGGGGNGYSGGKGYGNYGGGGGAFAEKTSQSLSGLTALAVFVGESGYDTIVRQNTSGGSTIALAKCGSSAGGGAGSPGAGGLASASSGDIKTNGGNGAAYTGGAAAGPNGVGVAPAGAATSGVGNLQGNLYGGGGSGSASGKQGWVELYFS